MGMVRLGRAGDALSYLQQCLDTRRELLPAGHPLVLSALGHLGEVRRRQGRLADACALHGQALELRQAQQGQAQPGGWRGPAGGPPVLVVVAGPAALPGGQGGGLLGCWAAGLLTCHDLA
jgi:hypothetical protein